MNPRGVQFEYYYNEKEARLKVINLSRLEEIKDLRTVWPHEALDFTPWLSQDDNISLLADAVGMDITVDETWIPE